VIFWDIIHVGFGFPGEVFDYLVSHGRMKEIEARAKFRQVRHLPNYYNTYSLRSRCCHIKLLVYSFISSFMCFIWVIFFSFYFRLCQLFITVIRRT